MKKKNVIYLYDEESGGFVYERSHPMKPYRIKMTHSLLCAYGLLDKLTILTPRRARVEDLIQFHDEGYINFIKNSNDKNISKNRNAAEYYNITGDSPFFPGLFEFCQISAGASITAAELLNSGKAEIAINWAGGLHHAKKQEASGFCYVNDCVLGILKLLERYQRVLYIDIDIHHGDGVEEAFYTTDRVFTVSLHKFGDFFPGTGALSDIGARKGKYYALNVPLRDGMNDEDYLGLFKPILTNVIQWYRPNAIFLQCGADSLAGDKLGGFNLSIHGHGECVRFIKSFGIPMVVAGGGGYTTRNVSRCWTYETAILIDEELDNKIPEHEFSSYYSPEMKLNQESYDILNENTPEEMQKILEVTTENLRHLPCAPSVQINPMNIFMSNDDDEREFEPNLVDKFLSLSI